jgi:hypothetical protein
MREGWHDPFFVVRQGIAPQCFRGTITRSTVLPRQVNAASASATKTVALCFRAPGSVSQWIRRVV